MENKAVTVGRWRYSEPAQTSDENGQLVIFSKSSVAPAEILNGASTQKSILLNDTDGAKTIFTKNPIMRKKFQ